MNPLTQSALEWFFALQDIACLERLNGTWRLEVINGVDGMRLTGSDPIELIEEAYERVWVEAVREQMRSSEP